MDQPSGPDVHSGTAGQDADSLRALTNEDRTYGRDVYESLRLSRDNLIRMGYESWL